MLVSMIKDGVVLLNVYFVSDLILDLNIELDECDRKVCYIPVLTIDMMINQDVM